MQKSTCVGARAVSLYNLTKLDLLLGGFWLFDSSTLPLSHTSLACMDDGASLLCTAWPQAYAKNSRKT